MHHISWRHGLISFFFEHLTHRFVGYCVHDFAVLQLIGQQMQGPTCASARRFATGDGDQLRLAFAIEHWGAITAALAASQRRLQSFLDTALAHLFDCLACDIKLLYDLPIITAQGPCCP